jgi:hypothetical protein
MKNTALQILGFALMVVGIQGVIRLLANDDAGLLGWLHADTSLLIAINVVIAAGGISLLSWAQKKSKG